MQFYHLFLFMHPKEAVYWKMDSFFNQFSQQLDQSLVNE